MIERSSRLAPMRASRGGLSCDDAGVRDGGVARAPYALAVPRGRSRACTGGRFPPGVGRSLLISGGGGAGVPGPWHSSDALHWGRSRNEGEAADRACVVDLDRVAVFVFFGQLVAGEEVGIDAVLLIPSSSTANGLVPVEISSTHPPSCGARRRALAEFEALRLPLVGVFAFRSDRDRRGLRSC